MMRSLTWIPIVHSAEDMGGLRESVHDAYVRRWGEEKWALHLKNVNELWSEIRRQIDELALDWARVRLYQDALPVCDHEESIVRELAEKGSDNHRLLVDLMGRGARLTGTESPQLLVEEYELNSRILRECGDSGRTARHSFQLRRRARQLLDDRDRYICAQIGRTLQLGEQGFIFLGMLHSFEGWLPRDIELAVLRPDWAGRNSDRPGRSHLR